MGCVKFKETFVYRAQILFVKVIIGCLGEFADMHSLCVRHFYSMRLPSKLM
jgi:hypothetical protein